MSQLSCVGLVIPEFPVPSRKTRSKGKTGSVRGISQIISVVTSDYTPSFDPPSSRGSFLKNPSLLSVSLTNVEPSKSN